MHIYVNKENRDSIEKIRKFLKEQKLFFEELESITFEQIKFEVPSGDMKIGFTAMSLGASSSGGW